MASTSSTPRFEAALIGSTLAQLAEQFPAAFFTYEKRRVPLKRGIHHDIAAAMPEVEKPLLAVLRCYTMANVGYQEALLKPGAMRVDLAGQVVEPVSAEHVEVARQRLAARATA